MSMYDPYARYRQRAAKRMSNFLLSAFAIASVFGAGFWLGGLHAQQNTYILEQEKRVLTEEQTRLQDEMTQMRAEAQTAMVRFEQLKADYDDIISEEPMQSLILLMRKQIEQGVDPSRLKSVITSVRPPQNCSDPENKRFIVKTPVYQGPVSKMSVAKGRVTISATGVSAQSNAGQKEAWFDPGQPIEVKFSVKGKKMVTKTDILPIYHSVIVKDKEYRFSLKAGNKSFVKVFYDHCDYP